MQRTKNLLALALLIIITLPTMVQISQLKTTNAVNLNVPVYLKVYAEPNPVGVGQEVYISLFFTKPIPNTRLSDGSYQVYTGLTVNLVKPDGTNKTFGPYKADTTGGVGGIVFIPEVAGNYTVQGFYAGQNITTGEHIMETMSEPDTFTVQEEQVPGSVLNPLPAEYWSRPIYATNYAWGMLGGNWWGLWAPSFTDTGGYDGSGNNFNPYSEAPNSAHIMWVKSTAFGGQVGLPVSSDQESQYTSTSILYRQFEPIILNGIIYYKLYPNVPTTVTSASGTPGWNAVDLRTGKLIWHKDTNETLLFAMNMQFHTVQEYGTQAYLVATAGSQTSSSGSYTVWKLYDPMTGSFIANITSASGSTSGLVETRDSNPQGTVYIFSSNSSGSGTAAKTSLTMWNSTLCITGPPATASSIIRPSGNINYTRGYQWSVDVPRNITNKDGSVASISLSITSRTNDAILLRYYPAALTTFATEFGESYAIEMAYNATDGKLLWGPVNRTLPRFHEISVVAAGDGYYVTHDKDTNEAQVYNLITGDPIGGLIQLEGNALATLERGGAIAYSKCYIWDFGGYVNAIDCKTGTLNWTYASRDAGYNTPYGVYPLWHFGSHSIADGKLFLSESRMYDPPLFADAHKLALNCTDGSVVWSALGFYGREPSAIADGYLVAWNSYDCQIYTYGKGPTSLTVSAPQTGVELGKSLVISGTVKDVSSGTTDDDRSARFPNGVAAVSDASQEAWMEYVYMQQPKPTNATGVLVTLNVMDANGNYRPIGTTTSDTDGYFTYTWKPDISGDFKVYASFDGSESYWPSQATTSFTVDEPAPTATPQPTQGPSIADTYFLPGIASIIVVIVIIGAAIMLMLRKRP
jgi:hypothetical protein